MESALHPYRGLDLTDEKGFLCGRLLADLGVDVIKIERPGGDISRNIGPFYHDIPHPERSLYWFAYNVNKRDITIDIESQSGQETFRKLVGTADFVIESFTPGYMDSLGLGYSALSDVNPRIIMTSITPFGQTGPYRDYKASDIVAMAMGGIMYSSGDNDRPPVRISAAQSYPLAGVHAAAATMVAHRYRELTGQGQHIDVSIHECIANLALQQTALWEATHQLVPRAGPFTYGRAGIYQREVWPCRDGEVCTYIVGGAYGRAMRQLQEWMEEEASAGSWKNITDWETVDMAKLTQERYQALEKDLGRFFMGHTASELYEEAVKRRFYLMPSYDAKGIFEDQQLAARNYWVELSHPELGTTVTYCGAACKLSKTPCSLRRRPPLIGEHNEEVHKELQSLAKEDRSSSGVMETDRASKQISDPLAGVKVLDFTSGMAGPLMTKYLGDYGAEVIKIESSLRPDISRVSSAFYKDGVPGLDRSFIFPLANSSKYHLALNLNHPKGVEIVKRLVASWADIVVEGFTPGVMAKWGLSYKDLKRIKPDIIMLSTSMQGQDGPRARHRGWGWNLKGLAGFVHLTGWPERTGTGPSGPYPDFTVPYSGLTALLAALDYRRRTGEGQYIDCSQFEASLYLLPQVLMDYAVNGRIETRMGNRSYRATPHGAYRCKGEDRWCVIAVYTDEEWKSFSRAIGEPEWTKDPKWGTLKGRRENEDELDPLVEAFTIRHSPEEVMHLMQASGVAAGVVEDSRDMIEHDPQLKHRKHFWPLDHPVLGNCSHMSWPAKLSKTPSHPRVAPTFGQHTEFICKNICGMTDEELAELLAAGVIEFQRD